MTKPTAEVAWRVASDVCLDAALPGRARGLRCAVLLRLHARDAPHGLLADVQERPATSLLW